MLCVLLKTKVSYFVYFKYFLSWIGVELCVRALLFCVIKFILHAVLNLHFDMKMFTKNIKIYNVLFVEVQKKKTIIVIQIIVVISIIAKQFLLYDTIVCELHLI